MFIYVFSEKLFWYAWDWRHENFSVKTKTVSGEMDLWISSVQFSHSVMSDPLQPHELQHARPPCPSPTPRVHPNPCPLMDMPSCPSIGWQCHPTISSCCPLLLLPSIFPSIRVFSSESALCIRWPKYWSFSFSISPSNEYSGLISFRMDWLDLLAVQGTLKSPLQHYSSKASILRRSAFFIVQLSHPYITTGKTIALSRQTFVDKVDLWINLFLYECFILLNVLWQRLFPMVLLVTELENIS